MSLLRSSMADREESQRPGDLRGLESEVARESVRQALFGRAIPRSVGRYRVERRCGRGAMGAVFEAHDPELDRKVALKLLERRKATPDALERLERQVLHEARAMARLHHPAVVTVYEVGRQGAWVFLAMELVGGPSLREWLHQAKPGWRRIVEVFCEIGEGLAAAHRTGLAHGDFKPDNLRFDETGRLRILDFGLARTMSAAGPPLALSPSTSSAAMLLSTGVEGFGGTPVYAAPERLDGEPADALSDQFSFFASLFECLEGQRPFEGMTFEELRRSIARGPQPRTRDSMGPNALRGVLARGLAEDPGARFPTMSEAVAALAQLRSRQPRRWLIGGSLLLGAGFLGWSLSPGAEPQPCLDPDTLSEAVWGSKREVLRSARPASTLAGPPWPRLESALGGYVHRWAEAMTAACTAQARGDAPEIAARQLSCLQHRRAGLERLLTRLGEGDPSAWNAALEATTELPDIAECDGLQPAGLPPPPPEIETDVDELRRALVVARVDADAGDLDGALATTQTIVGRARDLGYGPLHAEALMAEGKLLADLDHLEEASEQLRAAHGEALAVGHTRVAADTAVALVYVDGYQRAQGQRGHHWAWVARNLLRGLEGGEGLMSSLVANEAAVLVEEGQLDEADAQFRRAIELEEARPSPSPFVLEALRHNRGTVAVHAGDFGKAIEIHREVLEMRREIYGDDHPKVARGLSSLAAAERGLGRFEDALRHEREALERLERAHGRDSPALRLVLLGLAQAQLDIGDPEASAQSLKRLLGILEEHVDPLHPSIDAARQQLAIARMRQCRFDEAAGELEQILTRVVAREGAQDLQAIVRHNLGELRRRQGRLDDARALGEQALAHWESLGRERNAMFPRTALGMVALEEGLFEDARRILQEDLEIRERLTGTQSLLAAETAAGLGRALVGLGRIDEGIAALRRAVAIMSGPEAMGADPDMRMLAQAWLAEGMLGTGHPGAQTEARELLTAARRHFANCGDTRTVEYIDRIAVPGH